MVFNTAVIAGIEEYTSWDDVLALSSSEGDVVMFMGMKWRYHTSSGVWLPVFAYEGSPSNVITIDGDEANDAALTAKGWTVSKSGGGATSYDGTRVRFNSVNASADTAFAYFIHTGAVTDGYFAYGRARIDGYVGANYALGGGVSIRTGTNKVTALLRAGVALDYPVFWYNNGSTDLANGSYDASVSFATERFFLIHHVPATGEDYNILYVDDLSAVCVTAGNTNSTVEKRFIAGGTSGAAGSDFYLRNFVIARY